MGPLAIALAICFAIDPGIYIWGGVRGQAALENGANTAARAGFQGVRVVLSPVSRRTYGLGGERARTLSELFASDAFQGVIKHHEFHTVMFTAYDFASYGGQHYLDRAFLAANRQKVFDEYEQLTESIMRREAGSGRVFVIGHWEGDNQVYCGSSYKFMVDDAARAKCLGQNPEERMAGLREWLKIRQEAIAAGRDKAKLGGVSGVEVLHAVEFNTLFHFRGVTGAGIRAKEFSGVLDAVVPAVKPDVCSYSAWESLNPVRLGKDLKVVERVCGPARLVVGELGYAVTAERRDPTKDYLRAISALKKYRGEIAAVYFWEAFGREFEILSGDGHGVSPKALDAMIGLK